MIPRQIHQMWIKPRDSDADLPAAISQFRAEWSRLHPGFEMHLWNLPEALAAISPERAALLSEVAGIAQFEAMVADVARLVLTLEKGGYWIDLKIKPVRAWLFEYEHADLLLAGHFASEFIAPDRGVLVNGFFACTPGNKFIASCLDLAIDNIRRRRSSTVWELSGPKVFMDVRDSMLAKGEELNAVIIPHDHFWNRLVTNEPVGLGLSHWSFREQVEPIYRDNDRLADAIPLWRYKYLSRGGLIEAGRDDNPGEIFLPQHLQAEVFATVCTTLKPTYICDIGSLDGKEAELFSERNPTSHVIAFEANPENFFRTELFERTYRSRLSVQHMAISDADGLVEMHVPKPAADASDRAQADMRGMGSIFLRPDIPLRDTYQVPRRRLDSFFSVIGRSETLCLWIDVEGHTKEVLLGLSALIGHIPFMKLELETHAYWTGQSLDFEIIAMMDRMGFDMLARSDPRYTQYDALFVRRDVPRDAILAVIACAGA